MLKSTVHINKNSAYKHYKEAAYKHYNKIINLVQQNFCFWVTVDFTEQFHLTDQKKNSSWVREKSSEIITLKDDKRIQTFDQFKNRHWSLLTLTKKQMKNKTILNQLHWKRLCYWPMFDIEARKGHLLHYRTLIEIKKEEMKWRKKTLAYWHYNKLSKPDLNKLLKKAEFYNISEFSKKSYTQETQLKANQIIPQFFLQWIKIMHAMSSHNWWKLSGRVQKNFSYWKNVDFSEHFDSPIKRKVHHEFEKKPLRSSH